LSNFLCNLGLFCESQGKKKLKKGTKLQKERDKNANFKSLMAIVKKRGRGILANIVTVTKFKKIKTKEKYSLSWLIFSQAFLLLMYCLFYTTLSLMWFDLGILFLLWVAFLNVLCCLLVFLTALCLVTLTSFLVCFIISSFKLLLFVCKIS